MKVKEVMTADPVCCRLSDTAQEVAKVLRDEDIGSVPIVSQDRKLEGIITDRDLCCTIVAEGLDPQTTPVNNYVTRNPVACRADDDLEDCEKSMQKNQIRRMPVVDDQQRCIGMVAQADLVLREEPKKVQETVAEISKPSHPERPPAAA
ncbi:MAG TPA: CBS domain-containing protein [Terriglobales bacterium]